MKLRKTLRLFIATLLFTVSFGVAANAEPLRVIDDAKLLTSEEVQKLEKTISGIKDKYNMDVVIVTATDLGGKTAEQFADDYYDYNGYGFDEEHSGALLLIDMKDRYVHISTTGKAIEYIDDSEIDGMLDRITIFLGKGQYYKACNGFLDDFKFKMPVGLVMSIVISAIMALIPALLVRFFVGRSYKKSIKQKPISYVNRESVDITFKEDTFITSNVTKSKIQRQVNTNSPASRSSAPRRSGSTTHKSSSGRSHGGGGRHF